MECLTKADALVPQKTRGPGRGEGGRAGGQGRPGRCGSSLVRLPRPCRLVSVLAHVLTCVGDTSGVALPPLSEGTLDHPWAGGLPWSIGDLPVHAAVSTWDLPSLLSVEEGAGPF